MADVELVEQGWHLSALGYETCSEEGKNGVPEVIKIALDTDLRDIGEKNLPEGINKGRINSISGPCVLQVQKLRNVSAPKDNEESNAAPKLFKLSLTDGQTNCSALIVDPIDKLGLQTPPGTKIKLLGLIDVKHGFLLLNNTNTKVLGGRVEQLYKNWEVKRTLAKHTRVGVQTEGGPPPFVPFGQRDRSERPSMNRRDGFKSLELNKEEKKKDENDEFAMQRQATIAEALKGKEGKKTFGGGMKKPQDRDVAKLVEMGFTAEKAASALRQTNGNFSDALNILTNNTSEPRESRDSRPLVMKGPPRGRPEKGRGRGRGGDGDDEDYAPPPSKPSGPATLFDFLETKITTKDDTKENKGSASQTQGNSSSDSTASSRSNQYTANTNTGPTFFQKRMENLPPRFQKQQQKGQYSDSYNDTSQYSSRSNQGNRGRPAYESRDDYRGRGKDSRNDNDAGKPGRNDRVRSGPPQGSGREYSGSNREYSGGGRRPNNSADSSYRSNYDNSDRQNRNRGERFQDNRGQDYRGQGPRPDRSKGQEYEHRSREGSKGQTYNNRSGHDSNDRHNEGERYRGQEYNRGSRGQNYNDRSQGYDGNDRQRPQNYRNQDYHPRGQNKDYNSRPPQNDKSYNKSMTEENNELQNQKYQVVETQPETPPIEQTVTYSTTNGAESYSNDYVYTQSNQMYTNGQYSQVTWEDPGQVPNQNHVQQVEYYHDPNQPYQRKWKVGDYCLALYWEDKEFYRATIIGVAENLETCVVTFTDYGNTEEVPMSEIKTMPKSMLNEIHQYPPQAQYLHPIPFEAIDFSVPPPPLPTHIDPYQGVAQGTIEFRRGGQGHQYIAYQKT